MHCSTSDKKSYADKAVQTQDERASTPGRNSSKHMHSHNTLRLKSRDTVEHLTSSSDEKTIASHAAYIYSSPSDSQLGSSRPPLASPSRRTYKHPQLPYSRPTQGNNPDKRIASFPETVAVKAFGVTLTVPSTIDGPSLRVVSLPTFETGTLSGSPTMTEDNSSLEYLEISTDRSSRRSSGTGSVHLMHNFPPSDMPDTPSPPSSPESLLISGKGPGLPRSFLYETGLSADSAFIAASEDEAGWITWASSPPRPIPALHGPLSLPYARCPSGAEGTIIEDADLPRMIWGLDLPAETKRETTRAENGIHTTAQGTASRRVPVSLSDRLYSPESAEPRFEKNGTLRHESLAVRCIDSRTDNSHRNYSRNQCVWNDTPIQIHRPFDGGEYPTRVGDVGSDWRDGHTSFLSEDHKRSDLKSSAPTFIPSILTSQPVSGTYPRIFIEPRPGSQITAGRRLSAIEIAQRYRIEQEQSALPTPPNSSSPLWSPKFTRYTPSLLPLQEPGLYPIPQAVTEPLYTSGALSGRDFSEELRQIKGAKRKLNKIIGLPGVTRENFSWNVSGPLSPIPTSQGSFHRSSPAIDISGTLKEQSASVSHSVNPRIQDTVSPTLSTSRVNVPAPQRRNLLGQKPQSIPLACLMQRRLSSVAEEEANCSTNQESHPSNSHGRRSHSHLAHDEQVHSAGPPGSTFSKNMQLDSKPAHAAPDNWKRSKSDGKIMVQGGNARDESLHEATLTVKDGREKENISSSSEQTNIKKTIPRKKWRSRKKASGNFSSHSQINNNSQG
ncbi:hypothetical protein FPV67DRAFT_1668478 [Lyophyllum atratum]|nr:hypothetical protein FPV67DRAFT_1668478 [Lyophyllum atratum]